MHEIYTHSFGTFSSVKQTNKKISIRILSINTAHILFNEIIEYALSNSITV